LLRPPDRVEAVTFDFFNTLVRHARGAGGRGQSVMDYLHAQGLASDPWQHNILYDVFEPHAREYSPTFSPAQKQRYRLRLAERLFERLNVRCAPAAIANHAATIWQLVGPRSLLVFPDAPAALRRLQRAQFRLALVSNWQCGLRHFCDELGLAAFFQEILASAEIGSEKPDPQIFQEACRRLRLAPERVLHVGDTLVDDVQGARQAGIRAVLLCRADPPPADAASTITSLEQLPALLGLEAS
jgi:putative hydrolase of the HAD superfamily